MKRRTKIMGAVIGIGLVAGAIHGCVWGNVKDASTNSGIESATVWAYANCSGDGCAAHTWGDWVYTSTNGSGNYFFDPYGEIVDPVDAMYISPHSGEEAIRFYVSKSGYTPRNTWHRLEYEKVENDGKTYYHSQVDNVQLCPTGATDSDGDGLCDDAETHYGTDPHNTDTDGDSLSDPAELFGFDGLDLAYYGANPLRKDVFLEIDYYPGLGPSAAVVQLVVEAYANAPVSNPDGSTGISLHAFLDDEIAAADADPNLSPAWTDFDIIKANYFDSKRARVFHYALFANQYNGSGSSGLSRGIPAQDVIVSLGTWTPAGGTDLWKAGTLMHELGHNMGLGHGGHNHTNYKPHYISVMSYLYQLVGLTVDAVPGVLDYSRLEIESFSESSVNEHQAFSPAIGSSTTEAEMAHYGVRILTSGGRVWLTGNASADLDFDRDGIIEDFWQAVDLNGDGNTTGSWQDTQDDWNNLEYHGGGNIGDDALGAGALRSYQRVYAEEMKPCATMDDI